MTYFKHCTSLNEVKSLYRTLAKANHPDTGGDLVTMQAINNEYAYAVRHIAKGLDLSAEEIENEILNAEQYQTAVNAIINIEGINIEICGGWIWVTGNTYPHKSIFKSNGFFFAPKKVAWYFRSPEYKVNNRQKMTLEEIRTKYGTHQISSKFYTNQLS